MTRFFFFLALLFSRILPAQTLLDSLQQALAQTGRDTQRVRVLCQLSRAYYQVEQQKAEQVTREALELAKKLDDARGLSDAHNLLGNILGDKADIKGAIDSYTQSLNYREQLRDSQGIVISYNNIGLAYSEGGDKLAAIDYYVKGLAIADKIGFERGRGLLNSNIGLVYYDLKNYEFSEKYQREAITIYEKMGNKKALPTAYNNLGIVFKARGQYKEAKEFYGKALDLARAEKNPYRIAAYGDNIGVVLQDEKRYEEALRYNLEALEIRRTLQDPSGLMNSLINVGSTYAHLGQLDKAEPLIREAYAIGQAGNKWQQMEVANSMAALLAAKGNYKEAYEQISFYNQLKDSLVGAESRRQMAEILTRYKTEQQERENEVLRKDNALMDAEAKQGAYVRNFLFGFVALFLLLALVLFYAYRNKQRSNVALSQQKTQIELQKKEITDSITYARRIQQSILPPSQDMQQLFPRSFVLYLPKDIVSGDFYWIAQSGSTCLLAAADCTGHGVPGAFMSMLGIDKLNEIVKQEAGPGEMLRLLDRSVKNTLRQDHDAGSSGTIVQDGMDIALCAIEKGTLRYAGANRPLWLFRKGALQELKPTKAPIGGAAGGEQRYEEQQVGLLPGDRLYLFTDGFADQFGGPEGKKFMTRRMRELLAALQEKTLPDQKAALHAAFTAWQGRAQQVDDVLVIAVEIA